MKERSKEHRIYVKGKLNNICMGEFTLMCNVTNLIKTYGKENVEVKNFKTPIKDPVLIKEKEEWLKTI